MIHIWQRDFCTLVSGAMSPLKIGIKGGLQSMAGQDIALRANVVR